MNWYCTKCKKTHRDNELCPFIKKQLKEHPNWLKDSADFTIVAGEYALVTSQTLDQVAQQINRLSGTKLTYEGTHQFARDIQVFKRLNEEPFSRSGVFSTPENAKTYFENVLKISKDKPRALSSFESKLTGYSQETDWLRMTHGKLSSLLEKSSLLNNNAPGIDGITINRFTGKEISRTTIKASKNTFTPNSTGIKDVQKAIEKGYATENDIIFGPVGIKKAAEEAGLKNPVIEKNTVEQIRASNQRLERKIMNEQATNAVTSSQLTSKMLQGSIVGAAIGLTVSSLTNFVRYKNGELLRDEAFREISEDTVKGAITGNTLTAVTIFIPGGAIGFVAGVAIGLYVDKVCSNILDEIYGKGAYGAILDSSGYVRGLTFNLEEYYQKIQQNNLATKNNINYAKNIQNQIQQEFNIFEQMKGE